MAASIHGKSTRRRRTPLQSQVDATLRSQSNSQALWFTLLLSCIQAVYLAVLIVVTTGGWNWYQLNFLPMICQAASLTVRCLVLVVAWMINFRGRCLWVNQQVCHGLTVCLDGALVSLTNSEVQFFLYSRMPWLNALGEAPSCDYFGTGVYYEGGRCPMTVQMYQSIVMILSLSAFNTIFVLRFKHAVWSTSFAFTIFQVMRVSALGDTIKLGYDLMNITGPVVLLVILLVAKRMIESALRQLFLEILEKHREVVEEKVKRCQVEFQFDEVRAAASGGRGGSGMWPASNRGEDTLSSGAAFHVGQRCEEEDSFPLVSKLQEMASWGRREHWLLDPLQVTLQPRRVLGRGGFGTVFAGTLAGSPVAVKLARAEGVAHRLDELANELRIFRHVRHGNIAFFHGACFEPTLGVFGLVLELVEGTSLKEYVETVLNNRGKAMNPMAWSVLLDINRALYYLHTRDPAIIHGDIKPGNIMVEQTRTDVHAKVLDFGLSRILSPEARHLGGTRVWMAPEVSAGTCAPNTAADVYSFGRVAFFVVVGQTPSQGRLFWPNEPFSQRCNRIVERCLKQSPERRVDMGEVHRDLLAWPGDLGWPTTARGSLGTPWAEALRLVRGQGDDSFQSSWLSPIEEEDPLRAACDAQCDALWASTSTTTKLTMLVNLMAHWQVPGRASACCPMHSTAEDLVALHRMIQGLACQRDGARPDLQCGTCLSLFRHGGRGCTLCGTCSAEEDNRLESGMIGAASDRIAL